MNGKKYQSFEDLNIWKESMKLSIDVYALFRDCKDFGLKDQIQRASVSVPSNIAEGYERQSDKEFVRYLYIAKGSCGEVRTQLYLSISLKIIDSNIGNDLIDRAKKISSMIQNLISVRSKNFK